MIVVEFQISGKKMDYLIKGIEQLAGYQKKIEREIKILVKN